MISGLSVWVRIKGLDAKMPMNTKARKEKKARRMAVFAAASERSNFFSPRDRDRSALIPTPVPAPTAIMTFCRGKARVTAVRADSLIWATKTESTILYKACTSMEIIMGRDMETISSLTGMVPILFSRGISFVIESDKKSLPSI